MTNASAQPVQGVEAVADDEIMMAIVRGVASQATIEIDTDLPKDIRALFYASPAPAPEAPAGWQDISTAPRDGSMILLFNKHHGEQAVMGWTEGVMEEVFEDGFWSDVGGRNAAITMSVNPNYYQFWCPLPEPPALATQADDTKGGA